MLKRIFIYDDHYPRVQSLETLLSLSGECTVIGHRSNCEHVLQNMKEYEPDLVLMDINMPVVNGIEGLIAIKKNFPHIKVLIQTAFDDDDKLFTSIKNGASGYILKSDQPEKLLRAIQDVLAGGAVLNPAIAKKVMDYFSPQKQENPLSPKELLVIEHLAEGLSYKMVAEELNMSYATVTTHAKHIYQKLHISSLGEAISYYYKNIK